ncbi:MAG: hypothetical protein AB1765_02680, partial [Candidatus Hydrogenedentota bacterium]
FGIGMSLIAIPFYYAGDFFSRFCKGETAKEVMRHWFCSLLSILSAALTVVVAYLICRTRLDTYKSALCSIIIGFASPVWVYAEYFFNTVLTTFLLVLLFWRTFKDAKLYNSLIIGVIVSLLFLVRFDTIIAIFLLVVYYYLLYRNKQSILMISAWLFLALIIAAYYNYIRTGDILETGYENLWDSNLLEGLRIYLLSPFKSIFYYFPLLILTFFYTFYKLVILFRQEQESIKIKDILISWIIFLSYLLLYSFWRDKEINLEYGPRLMVPYLILLFISIYSFAYKEINKILFFIIFLFSVFIQLCGTSVVIVNMFYLTLYNHNRPLTLLESIFGKVYIQLEAIAIYGSDVIMTRLYGGEYIIILYAIISFIFFTRALYYVRSKKQDKERGTE